MSLKVRLAFLVLFSVGFLCAHVSGQGETGDTPKNTDAINSTPKPVDTTPKPSPAVPIAPAVAPKVSPKSLIAITLLDPPFVISSTRGEKQSGLVIDILNEAVKGINYDDVKITIHDDAYFGYEEKPGEWTGLIGALQNKTAHVALAAFTISSSRSKAVSFSQPFMHAGFRVLYKIPESWHPSEAMVTILRPFSPGLWVLIVFMFGLASASLYIIGRYSPYEDIAFVGKTATYDGLTVANSLLYVFSSLVWQGYTAAPKSISGRIVACVWWVFTIFAIGSYIAGLCVVLFKTNPEIRTLPFTTMEEMSRQSKVGIMVVENSAAHKYLTSSPSPLEQNILAMINRNKKEHLVDNTEHGIDKMVQSDGRMALLMDGPTAEYLSTLDPCDKMVIGEPLGFHTFGFACNNETDVCDKLSTEILAMRENGKLASMKEKWFNKGCLLDRPKNYIYEGLPFFDSFGGEPDAIMPLTITIKRFSAAFIILIIGLVIAGVVLIAEIVWAKRRGTAVPRKLNHSVAQDDDLERIQNEFHDERS
jgi:ABC-type amino acid transport substrate-binding protein